MLTDLSTFLLDNSDKLFSYLVYKKVFTPFEMKQCYRDESMYTENNYTEAFIVSAVELPDKDVLLGFQDEYRIRTTYHKLSDIELSLEGEE